MSTTVLVVEDEEDIRNLMVLNLKREGFEVFEAADGQTGLALLREHRPPILLLDLMLPDTSGIEVCEQLRGDSSVSNTFVIMVTARTEEDDRLTGFEVGADDYVTKPFSVKELVLRVKAAARRVERSPHRQRKTLVRGPLSIDMEAHHVYLGEQEVLLTATEFRLLCHLADQPGRLCSRGELLEEVWELPPHLNTRTVDTHIKRLRHKLAEVAACVETVRGVGYRFREADE